MAGKGFGLVDSGIAKSVFRLIGHCLFDEIGVFTTGIC